MITCSAFVPKIWTAASVIALANSSFCALLLPGYIETEINGMLIINTAIDLHINQSVHQKRFCAVKNYGRSYAQDIWSTQYLCVLTVALFTYIIITFRSDSAYFSEYGQALLIDTGNWSMQLLWQIGHLIIDNSPKLKYVAHQKHEGHNRKSTRLSMSFRILPTVSLPPSRLDKVFFLRSVCFLSINIW